MRMVNEYYSSPEGKFEFLVSYLNEETSRGKFITDIYHHPAMSVLELLRGMCSIQYIRVYIYIYIYMYMYVYIYICYLYVCTYYL